MEDNTNESQKSVTTYDVGNLIHWEIIQRKIKKKDLAKYLGINIINLSYYFRRASLQTDLVWKISKCIQFNFFGFLAEKVDVPYQTQAEKTLQKEVETLQQELLNLQRENELLKELIKK